MTERRFVIKKGQKYLAETLGEIQEAIRASAAKRETQVIIKGKERSGEQNRALFGCAYPIICAHTGYRPNDIHHVCLCGYFGSTEVVIGNRHIDMPVRTTTTNHAGERDVITRKDFADFYAYVQQWAALEYGLNIPEPDKNWRRRMMEER